MQMLAAVSTWFDYIFYRSALFYRNEGHLSSILIVTVIKTITLIDVYIGMLYFFKQMEFIDSDVRVANGLPAAIFIINLIIDYRYYKGKFDAFEERWRSEPKRNRVIKGCLVLLTFVMPFMPVVIKGFLST